jgi:hypothetical protein
MLPPQTVVSTEEADELASVIARRDPRRGPLRSGFEGAVCI